MKPIIRFFNFCFLFNVILFVSCKKDGIAPTVETARVTEISTYSALCGGTVTDEGSGPVTARGICWGTKLNPTLKDIVTQDGNGLGTFTSNLNGLYSGVAYYVRAYATNNSGTGYGITKSFSASGQTPESTVGAATNIFATGATLNGVVNASSISTNVFFQYGPTANYDSTVYAIPSPLTDNTDVPVSADISGLKASTLYHFRIMAVNYLGTFFSGDNSFRTTAAKSEIPGIH